MSDFVPGLEGVIAFETKIAEPDRSGGSLRYRGVDIEDLVGRVSYGNVWGLLVDNEFNPGLPPAEPYPIPVHSGDVRVDVQSAIAMLAPGWGLQPLLDIDDEQSFTLGLCVLSPKDHALILAPLLYGGLLERRPPP